MTSQDDIDTAPFPRRYMLSGSALIVVLFASITVWTAAAPIDGAVVSPGVISVASFRKQIQHLEGGIVKEIHVQDGDRVKAGDVLVSLRDVNPRAALTEMEQQYYETQAIVARLLAERDGNEDITFPDELVERSSTPAVASIVAAQRNVLLSRRSLRSDQRSVLEHKISQEQEAIKGLRAQIEAKNRQRALVIEEHDSVAAALARNAVPRSMLLKLERDLAELDGDLSAHRADIGRLSQSVLELRLSLSQTQAEHLAEVVEELRNQRSRLFSLTQSLLTARDTLSRTQVLSPIDGVVVNLQIHTQDGVIRPGQPLMEIVPSADELVVHAYVNPDDINDVRSGMSANVQLTSISRRERIPMKGVVTDVSADRLFNEQTKEDYYRARIALSPDLPESVQSMLVAGMGVDVFILTGARTPIDYLLTPITKTLRQGMRER